MLPCNKVSQSVIGKLFKQITAILLILSQIYAGTALPLFELGINANLQTVLMKQTKSLHSVIQINRDTSTFVPRLKIPQNPSDIDLQMARVFPVPLIPISKTAVGQENHELGLALKSYQLGDKEDVSAFTNFIGKHPESRWNGDLYYNLGTIYYETGYLDDALNAWQHAWDLLKKEDSSELHALADSALGRLALTDAELGRTEELRRLFAETKNRGFYGAAEQQVRAAQSGYRLMQAHPALAFKCGPFALDSVRSSNANVHRRSSIVQGAASTSRGTSLAMVQAWANQLKMNYQTAKRSPGSSFIVPSVMHWKIGHFGALVRIKKGKYLIQDPTFAGYEMWVGAKALEKESSGYFLVPQGPLPLGWTSVSTKEASKIWGRGGAQSQDINSITQNDKKNCSICPCPMTVPSTFSMLAGLYLQDTPIRYSVPVGPVPDLSVSYAYETSTPPLYPYSNLGYNWSFHYISFITVDASNNVQVTLPGGGTETANYSAFDDVNNVYPPDIKSQAQIYVDAPGIYDRHLPDGSRQVFSQADGAGRIFLKQVFDPKGNSLLLSYDSNFRLTSIQDQVGQSTTVTYLSNTFGNVGFYKISAITDPFGRSATFQYDSVNTALLVQITDVLGISSRFTYDSNYFVDSLSTPYGRTLFDHYIPTSDPDGESGLRITWPDGTQSITESYIGHELNSYYWDRKSSPQYPNKSSARVTNFQIDANSRVESGIINFTHEPLEGAPVNWASGSLPAPSGSVQYNYAGSYNVQPPTNPPPPPEDNFVHYYTGISNLPTQIFRTLDNGDTQLYQYVYNLIGKVTEAVDPIGRTLTFYYDGNNIDLLQVRQTKGNNNDLLLRNIYNTQHEPLSSENGSGQITTYTYNPLGQILTITRPAPGGTTTYNYNSNHYLTSIVGPLPGGADQTAFGYDNFGRISTVTDSEGYQVAFTYDNYDRVTSIVYPDGTYEQVSWLNLDPVFLRDRLGNWTRRQFDSLRQLIAVTDPIGRTTQYQWCTCGALGSITDPNGNVTSWSRDLQGRTTVKTYPDLSTKTYLYENNTSRLKSVTDALGQVTNYSYYDDDKLSGITYTGSVNSTGNVSYSYDPNYPRIVSIAKSDWGTLSYSYNSYITDPLATPITGGGKVSQILNSVLGSSATLGFSYDALDRMINQSINRNANSMNTSFDSMDRITGSSNLLGSFTYHYVDDGTNDKGTNRLSSIAYPNGQVTDFSYDSNERLNEINNLNSSGSILSQFTYSNDPEGQILSWKEETDSNPPNRFDLAYDPAHQLSSAVLKVDSSNAILHQYYYSFDAGGNRASEQVDSGVTMATSNHLNQAISFTGGGPTRFQGVISQPGTVTINQQPAQQTTSTNFVGNPTLNSGTNVVTIVATNGNGTSATNSYQVVIPPSSTISPTYDAVGELTSNGNGQTYAWDAANRLVKINYSGGSASIFSYDGLGRMVSVIEESSSGSVTSTKNYLWIGSQMVEERDGNNDITKRFYSQGEQQSGTNYYYTRDHLGSVREVTNASGTTMARYNYDPFGRVTLVSGSNLATFQYDGYYSHIPSSLDLTLFRSYDSNTGRWLSRDPLPDAEMSQGPNLYEYVQNEPMANYDPLGLDNINLTPPGTPEHQIVDDAGTNPDSFSVGAHGASNTVRGPDDRPISPQDLANMIKSRKDYNPKNPVYLNACSTGAPSAPGYGPDDYAQQLANALKNTVYAPTYSIERDDITNPVTGNHDVFTYQTNGGSYQKFTPR